MAQQADSESIREPTEGRLSARCLWGLVLLSLIPRLIVFAYFVSNDVQPVLDEGGYKIRFEGAARAIADLPSVEKEPYYLWFGGGKWPPLYPLFLAIGHLVAPDGHAGARAVNVIFSVLTTGLIAIVAGRLTGSRKAALVAAGLHIVHPQMIVYAVFLWSEAASGFFLTLCLLLLIRADEATGASSQRKRYVGAGLAMAATLLIRIAALPIVCLLPLYLAWRGYRRGKANWRAMPLYFLATVVVAVLPFQVAICAYHQQFMLLSTTSNYNLYLANNPWVPLESGSSWDDPVSRNKIHRQMETLGPNESLGSLAKEEIRRAPGQAIVRFLARLRMMWTPDFYFVRHITMAVLPPWTADQLFALCWVTLMAFLAVGMLAVYGLFHTSRLTAHPFGLLLIFLAGLTAGPALTVANSRYHFTVVLLLLPIAALGLTTLARGAIGRRGALALLVGLVCVAISVSTMPIVVQKHLHASSYYAELLTPISARFERNIAYRDELFLRLAPGTTAPRSVFVFDPSEGSTVLIEGPYPPQSDRHHPDRKAIRPVRPGQEVELRLTPGYEVKLILAGSDCLAPITVSVRDEQDHTVALEPAAATWQRWQPTAIDTLQVRWAR